jgi:hypothetical protein
MWQLKLSSGGGTYGIHFCFVFDDDWSFKPKNIVVVVVVVFLVVREKTTCSSYKKKLTRQSILPPQLLLASDDLIEWVTLTSRLFSVDSPLTLDLKRSEAKLQRRLSFSWKRNDTNQFCKRQFLRSAGKKKEMR